MIGSRRLFNKLVPVAVLATGACFATQRDMRVLQSDLQVVRAEMAAGDSAIQASLDQAMMRVTQLLLEVSDTVKSSNAITMRLRADVRSDLQAIREQLITIQELTGQSQRRIQDLRAEMETRASELAAPVTPPAGTTRSDTTPARPQAGPGPAQLYQIGQDQFRRGSNSAARTAFSELLKQHPTSDLAPDALYGIAETWSADGDGVQADSVYALVVQRYPRSSRAPTALYKRATALRIVGQTEQARAFYQQLVDKYPESEAALLAREYLRASPQ